MLTSSAVSTSATVPTLLHCISRAQKQNSLTCRSMRYLYTCRKITFINNVFASTGAQATDKSLHHFEMKSTRRCTGAESKAVEHLWSAKVKQSNCGNSCRSKSWLDTGTGCEKSATSSALPQINFDKPRRRRSNMYSRTNS